MKTTSARRNKNLFSLIADSLKYKGDMDLELIILIIVMTLFGLIMVASASSVNALYLHGDSMLFFRKQIIVALLGLIAMLFMSKIDYHLLTSPRILTPVLITVWLAVFLVAFIGEDINGARRWISIAGLTFQPSELAKIAWVLLFAVVCSKQKPKELKTFSTSWVRYLILVAIIDFPLMLQPHKSAMLLITLVCIIIAMVAGARIRYFLAVLPAGAAAFLVLALSDKYSLKRLTSFLDPFADTQGGGWQAVQSLYAIGSGGVFGTGIGQSVQKANIPEPHCDFIFPVICEELGFIGAFAVIALFFLLLVRCVKIAMEAPDKLGALIAIGIATLIFAQAIINIAVVTAWFPVTGMPLPFFSAGGTSLLFTMASMGIVLNVSRQRRKNSVKISN